ncbi:HAD family hydrolase [Litoribacter ruber]|uniref:HAD family hydrolase n=1 Tax=Litoribacter ruber TaxID=702568 RepID=UPI001BD959A5|nr:HAD family hydrolase [Litoribacter ruber]MBT0811616.1 HAD family hydrolase [Litoribacter ruber]
MDFHFKKAMIYDLDNTLYPVKAIGDKLFAPVLEVIAQDEKQQANMDGIRKDIMRIPFQDMAKKYDFGPALTQKGEEILQETTYNEKIPLHEDYPAILEMPGHRFLVTTGFYNMQKSKIDLMELEKDFQACYIIDPMKSDQTKKEIFLQIIKDGNFELKDVMVIGDDPESEIAAGNEIGVETVLYDKHDQYQTHPANHKIRDFRELVTILIN